MRPITVPFYALLLYTFVFTSCICVCLHNCREATGSGVFEAGFGGDRAVQRLVAALPTAKRKTLTDFFVQNEK